MRYESRKTEDRRQKTEVGSPKTEGLNTGVRAYIDKPALAKKLNLRAGQVIVLGQSVGYLEE